MENVLIILLLVGGFVGGIYLAPQIARLCRAITVVDMGDKRYDRNSYPEGD